MPGLVHASLIGEQDLGLGSHQLVVTTVTGHRDSLGRDVGHPGPVPLVIPEIEQRQTSKTS